jgi:hypothetical protein
VVLVVALIPGLQRSDDHHPDITGSEKDTKGSEFFNENFGIHDNFPLSGE